jgi:hypothetical protein
MTISMSRGTLGVRSMPDKLDSNHCGLRCGKPAEVRINLDGIWTNLCLPHLLAFREALNNPEPAP